MLRPPRLRIFQSIWIAFFLVIYSASCSRLQKRNDGGGQGSTSTVDERGNTQPVESTDSETGGSATADENALSDEDSIYVEEGVELATDVTGAYLTLPPGVERGGDSVSVFPAKIDTKILTFVTVKVPLDAEPKASGASLVEDNRELVVFYKIRKPDGTVLIGVRPVAKEAIVGNEIIFQTAFFGVFQAGYVGKILSEPIEKPVETTVFTKKEETAVAPLVWEDLLATVDGTRLKFSASYNYSSDLTFCLVRITKDTPLGSEVLRAEVQTPQIIFTTPEVGVPYFGHFKCRARNGIETPQNTSKVAAMLPLTAPLAKNFNAAMTEDIPLLIPLAYESSGAKPDGCAVTGVLNVTATCSCDTAGCSVQVTPAADFHGTALLDFTLAHKTAVSQAKRATISVQSVDDAPIAKPINLGVVNKAEPKTVVLNYSDVDGDQATVCALSDLQNAQETPSCVCTDGLCAATITFPAVGTGSFKYNVTAGGVASNQATVTFDAVTNPPASVKFVRLDFSYPVDSSPVLLKDKIVLSGGGDINDYDFFVQGIPDDSTAMVTNFTASGRLQRGNDQLGDTGSGNTGVLLTNPVYLRGTTPLPFDSFRFALRHKSSGNWLDNASPASPAWAFTCNASELTSWNDRRQGVDGPYLICSKDQFLQIGANCKSNSSGACNQNFRQIADIDFAAGGSYSDFVGNGTDFEGSYDGAGHEVKNYQIVSNLGFPSSNIGLFGSLGGTAKIERLRLHQFQMNFNASGTSLTSAGFLVGRSEGSDIVIRDIEVSASTVQFSDGSNSFGAIVGSALQGTSVSNVRIKNVTLTVPDLARVQSVGPVFGLAADGAQIERASVDSETTINVGYAGPTMEIGGLGGRVVLSARVRESYTRAVFVCNSTYSAVFGALFSRVEDPSTELTNLYSEAVIPSCTNSVRGGVAGALGSLPTMSGINFDQEKAGTTVVFGGFIESYPSVTPRTTQAMSNNAFSGWDFVDVWQLNANEPPTLKP